MCFYGDWYFVVFHFFTNKTLNFDYLIQNSIRMIRVSVLFARQRV